MGGGIVGNNDCGSDLEEAEGDATSACTADIGDPHGETGLVAGWAHFLDDLLQSHRKSASFLQALQQLFAWERALCETLCAFDASAGRVVAILHRSKQWSKDVSLQSCGADLGVPALPASVVFRSHLQNLLHDMQAARRSLRLQGAGAPCIAVNRANGRFFPVAHLAPWPWKEQLLCSKSSPHLATAVVFGSSARLAATENFFLCCNSTRMDCRQKLEQGHVTVALRICACIRSNGSALCGRGLAQLCLILGEQLVECIVMHNSGALLHVGARSPLQAIGWTCAVMKLREPSCYFFVYNSCTQEFAQALLRSDDGSWLGKAQRTARSGWVLWFGIERHIRDADVREVPAELRLCAKIVPAREHRRHCQQRHEQAPAAAIFGV